MADDYKTVAGVVLDMESSEQYIKSKKEVVRNKSLDENQKYFMSIFSALFYGLTSILIMLINKSILTHYKFPSAQVLGVGQMASTVVILFCLKNLNIIRFPNFNSSIPSQIFPLPLFYMGNLICGLKGTKTLSLPMFVVLRRFTILITMIGEFIILRTVPNLAVITSVMAMISGAIVAAFDDLAFDFNGYFFVILNDFLTAGNSIYSKKKLDAKELGKYTLLYYNCLFMIIPASILAFFTGNIDQVLTFEHWSNINFQVLFVLSCVMGFVLMYSTLLCTSYNSPLTTNIIGSMKNILITFYGIVFGTDYIFSMANFVGLSMSAIASIVYTFVVIIFKKG